LTAEKSQQPEKQGVIVEANFMIENLLSKLYNMNSLTYIKGDYQAMEIKNV